MLDSGEIILDLSGEERKNTTMEDMIKNVLHEEAERI